MPITINFAEIANKIDKNTLILTPNSRTQKAINAGFVETLTEGDVVYAPALFSFSQWLQQMWQSLSFERVLPQVVGGLELKSWLKEKISSDPHWQLTNELGVAEKVLSAYQNLVRWGMTLEQINPLQTPEAEYFVNWCSALEEFLVDKSLIADFSIINHLANCPIDLKSLLPQKLLLVGFDQFTPIEKQFLNLCEELGTQVEFYYPSPKKSKACRVEFDDLNEEMDFAARLAHKLHQEKPDNAIGVVVHQLAEHLTLVNEKFSEHFQPQEQLPWQPIQKAGYNVSAGQSLSELPMINVGLKILQLSGQGLDLQTLLLLKNSPFINWGENTAYIKAHLHRLSLLGYGHYSLPLLLQGITNSENVSHLSLLAQRLESLCQQASQSRPVRAWIDKWKSQLKFWGWGEGSKTNEMEQKVYDEFNQVLQECLALEAVYAKVSQAQARDYLQQQLNQASFQLPSDRTSIHVLGVLEATGLSFDSLILVGFKRDNWPQKARLNPFLPVEFQQLHNMPGSSAEREYDYTLELSSSLLGAADNVWITQSRAAEQGFNNGSPLFAKFPLGESKNWIINPKPIPLKPDYVWVKDDAVKLELGDIKGGAYLLSNYASCPFKAISRFQFNLRAPEPTQKGISPKTRGSWLHRALEIFWDKLKNQQALLALTAEEQVMLVEEVVQSARREYSQELLASAPIELIDQEGLKLIKQIEQWLTLETMRAPFSTETEIPKTLQLGPLNFSFKIDRIDTNENGLLEIIDYKTGNVDVKKWLGQRPEEAQMPAYVLACEETPIASLTYGKLKTGEVSRDGVYFDTSDPKKLIFKEDRFLCEEQSKETSEEENEKGSPNFEIISKDKTRYIASKQHLISPEQTLAAQWRQNLTTLAERMASGDMPVSPKNPTEACRYCEFGDFCRIDEDQPDEDQPDEYQTDKGQHYENKPGSSVTIKNESMGVDQ